MTKIFFLRIFQTARHLKFIQLFYQILYRIKSKSVPTNTYDLYFPGEALILDKCITHTNAYKNDGSFAFLNLNKRFDSIDWNCSDFGKLWTYNLNYFDYLQQEYMSKEEGLKLILDFCDNHASHKDAYEPYPISLRAINWVKFLSHHMVSDETIDRQLYNDLFRLYGRLEYHILANHLFENGFGLLFGAYYFRDEKLYTAAVRIIRSELKEQILPDGAHYELTPMYHEIVLYRILDCYQLVSSNDWKSHELGEELKKAAQLMLGWLNAICYSNGDLPMINDSTLDIAPTREELLRYANDLEIYPKPVKLCESGYRKLEKRGVEVIMDVGNIAPSYQPGHSHADNLQILIHKNQLPCLVDTGISTYEKNERRQLERSTSSHNTVTVNDQNSSEVWSGFRVGRRANTTIHEDKQDRVTASHNGYRKLGVTHHRKIFVDSDRIVVHDKMTGKLKNNEFKGHLHFHPDRTIELQGNQLFVDGSLFLEFDNSCIVKTENYGYCQGYNKLVPALKVTYTFAEECNLIIRKD